MLPQQPAFTSPQNGARPEIQAPPVQYQAGPEINEQFIEAVAQRLMPRIMPEIMYQVRAVQPTTIRNRSFGMSLALAIVSLALMIPLIAILLGEVGVLWGVVPALISISLVCLTIVLINVLFNMLLFNSKS